jgi:hypothetical protein
VLRELYHKHTPAVRTDSPGYQKELEHLLKHFPKTAESRARLAVTQNVFTRLYRISTTSPRRSYYNFDVSVGFRQRKGEIMVIPYCDWAMAHTLDFLEEDRRLKDYHYQNQTDRPDHLSAKQWGKRRRYYEGMFKAGQWEDVLVLDICKWDMWYHIDPAWDMAREMGVQ